MVQVDVEVRRWGNSLATIIPSEVVRSEDLKEHDKIRIEFRRIKYPEPGSFGDMKHAKMSAREFKDEIRRVHDF